MNRHDRRALKCEQHAYIADLRLTDTLMPLAEAEWPALTPRPMRVWRSKKFLAQLYSEASIAYPSLMRLSVCRTKVNDGGQWQDGITWEELQTVKRECGLGGWYGVEVYPPDADVVNVANFRHVWLLATPLEIGWFK